jgi:hypothetical protein
VTLARLPAAAPLRTAALLTFTALLAAGCASAPRPTARSRELRANPPAIVEGVVTDTEGRPVAGIGVRGVPRGKDIPWYPPATTAADGAFRLRLAAPGSYGFLLVWKDESVITPDPRDPALLEIELVPGETRRGVRLLFLRSEWERDAGR